MPASPALVLLAAALGAAGCVHFGASSNTSVARVEKQLDQAVPVGSTRAEVDAWLRARGIGSSYTERPDADSSPDLADAVPDMTVYKGLTTAIIRDTDRSLFVTGNVQLCFLFGADDRLAKRIVRWVGTGP